jgi:sensor histidine kinase YesM
LIVESSGIIHQSDAVVAISIFIFASILFGIISFFIKRWQKSVDFSAKELLKIASASLAVCFLLSYSLLFVVSLRVDPEIEFNKLLSVMYNTIFGLFNAFIYGGFFLTYYYYRKNKNQQEQLIASNQALSESRINQLKTQLNPHFLFNNLNVLDQLIEENKIEASEFLNEFAEVYRYVLQVSDKKIVPISEELAFAEKYFNLIKHKYENAYQLNIENNATAGEIVPLTLQLMIENAVRHNLGTAENPIFIDVKIDNKLVVRNNVIPKQQTVPRSGKGLKNLDEQYALLSNSKIVIEQSEHFFTVTTPIIEK